MLMPTAIQRYTALMLQKGFSADSILRGAGIQDQSLYIPNYYVERRQCREVVENMIRVSGDHGIGLDAGLHVSLQNLGVVGHVLLSCKTIRETFEPWIRFGEPLTGIVGKFKFLSEDSGSVSLEFTSADWSDPLSMFHVEELIGVLLMVGKSLATAPLRIKQTTFAYPAPTHVERYHDLLRCPIRFNAKKTVITLDTVWVEQILRLGDEEFNRICLQHCEDRLQRIKGSTLVSSDLRTLFLRSSMADLPSLNTAAAKLRISSRTLRRHLEIEGTSFRQQIDLFRAERAKEYVRHRLTTKEIASRLGFADPSGFRHAFKEWTGQTINEYRESALNPPALNDH